jgi:AraC-like DNA-binding protein
MSCFCPTFFGRQYRGAYAVLPRHRHQCGYLALVVSGGYEEAGDQGRCHVREGDVVIHSGFEAHLNRYRRQGAEVLNLPLPPLLDTATPFLRAADPDAAVRLAERDPQQAVEFLLATVKPLPPQSTDWPDDLAAALLLDPQLQIRHWAGSRGLALATVSRGFRKVFGVSPSAYRAQARGRLAWRRTVGGGEPLSLLALDCGFCDQAHMTRAVRAVTGKPPGVWRQQIKCVQDLPRRSAASCRHEKTPALPAAR